MKPIPFPSQAIDALFGEIRPVLLPQQPNATDFVYTVGAGYYQRLLACQYGYTTDATAGNRFPGYAINDQDGQSLFIARASTTVPVSTSVVMSVCPWVALNVTVPTSGAYVLSAPQIWLWPGCKFKSSVFSMLGTDHIGFVNMWWECIDRELVERYYSRESEDVLREHAEVMVQEFAGR